MSDNANQTTEERQYYGQTEVTREMIDAGSAMFTKLHPDQSILEVTLIDVYRAMEAVREK
jgi:hypothetical protein